MRLIDFFTEDRIKLDLAGETPEEVFTELVGLLGLSPEAESSLLKLLKRRENLGSTGIGRGIAIPHCRASAVDNIHVVFGRRKDGLDFRAIDDNPVKHFFLIVAPPMEVSNQYLPVLGKVAQFAKNAEVPEKLEEVQTAAEFLSLLGDLEF